MIATNMKSFREWSSLSKDNWNNFKSIENVLMKIYIFLISINTLKYEVLLMISSI